jgi:hypothetical protein
VLPASDLQLQPRRREFEGVEGAFSAGSAGRQHCNGIWSATVLLELLVRGQQRSLDQPNTFTSCIMIADSECSARANRLRGNVFRVLNMLRG